MLVHTELYSVADSSCQKNLFFSCLGVCDTKDSLSWAPLIRSNQDMESKLVLFAKPVAAHLKSLAQQPF